MRKIKQKNKPVHFEDHQGIIENLPFPYIIYPTFYGTFIAFKKYENSTPTFCSCSINAIKNYIKYYLENAKIGYHSTDHTRNYLLDSFDFPKQIVADLINKNVAQNFEIIDHLKFEDRICHICNNAVPNYRYCHEMYGGSFVQNYGWYINQKFWDYGIHPRDFTYDIDKCPHELIEIFGVEYQELKKKFIHYTSLQKYKLANEISTNLNKINNRVKKYIENKVRDSIGYKKIGESWTNETNLYYIIKNNFPNLKIKRHYKPEFLEKLELDIYIENYKIGIEYQGVQHFKPIKHWGGKSAFEKLKERDKKKKLLCEKNDINLIYFYYSEKISEAYIKNKILKNIKP